MGFISDMYRMVRHDPICNIVCITKKQYMYNVRYQFFYSTHLNTILQFDNIVLETARVQCLLSHVLFSSATYSSKQFPLSG
jgi:hypothetical protein